MILATHALVGAALGKNISNPWIVAVVAVPLHFVFDHFRHGEYVESSDKKTNVKNTWWKITLDIAGAVVITSAIILFAINYSNHFTFAIVKSMAIGMFFSILPDLLNVLYWEFHWPFLKKIHDFHAWCHKYPPFSKEREWTFRNARNDIIFSVIAIILLIF